MKKFNEEIQITIEVDAIALQLRSMFKEDSANADVVVEQIIGRSLSKDYTLLSKIMSAMNGFQKEINVKVGETYLVVPFNTYGYWTPKSIEENNSVNGLISEVTVIRVNPYGDEEVFVEYQVPNKKGTFDRQERWIKASSFSL
tara:strand:- start:132 stop:560 length:429 start_codon:yes stop_codon:yes gene_type:complete